MSDTRLELGFPSGQASRLREAMARVEFAQEILAQAERERFTIARLIVSGVTPEVPEGYSVVALDEDRGVAIAAPNKKEET